MERVFFSSAPYSLYIIKQKILFLLMPIFCFCFIFFLNNILLAANKIYKKTSAKRLFLLSRKFCFLVVVFHLLFNLVFLNEKFFFLWNILQVLIFLRGLPWSTRFILFVEVVDKNKTIILMILMLMMITIVIISWQNSFRN